MESRFFKRGTVLAVGLSVLKTVYTAPHNLLDTAYIPRTPSVSCSAFSAFQHIGECVSWVPPLSRHAFCRCWLYCASANQFFLSFVEVLSADNWRMSVVNIVHWSIAGVLLFLFADAVNRNSFLKDRIAAVLFIPKDTEDCCRFPNLLPAFGLNALFQELIADFANCFPADKCGENFFDNLCFFRYYFRFWVLWRIRSF